MFRTVVLAWIIYPSIIKKWWFHNLWFLLLLYLLNLQIWETWANVDSTTLENGAQGFPLHTLKPLWISLQLTDRKFPGLSLSSTALLFCSKHSSHPTAGSTASSTAVVQPKLRKIIWVKWTLLMVWRGWPWPGRLRRVSGEELQEAGMWVTDEGQRNSGGHRQFWSGMSPCSMCERLALYWEVVGTVSGAWVTRACLGGTVWMLTPSHSFSLCFTGKRAKFYSAECSFIPTKSTPSTGLKAVSRSNHAPWPPKPWVKMRFPSSFHSLSLSGVWNSRRELTQRWK